MREAGCWFPVLPPYNPDLNPMEMAFSRLKAHLRRIGARTFTDVFSAVAAICDLYSLQECWNYFASAGYVASQRRDALNRLTRTTQPCSGVGKTDQGLPYLQMEVFGAQNLP